MAVKRREYLFSINNFNKPEVAEDSEAVGLLLMELILLNPGSDPLHPSMGVGIEKYRYALNKLDELKSNIDEQIRTYLPEFQNSSVNIVEITSEKICNIEITIGDTIYVYDSNTAPVPITLSEIKNN